MTMTKEERDEWRAWTQDPVHHGGLEVLQDAGIDGIAALLDAIDQEERRADVAETRLRRMGALYRWKCAITAAEGKEANDEIMASEAKLRSLGADP
jgi:hypothetical protein